MALINCPECGHEISDSLKRCHNCGIKIKKVKEKKKLSKKQQIIVLITVVATITALVEGGLFLVNKVIKPMNAYKSAEKTLNDGKYEDALTKFEKLGNYKDSKKMVSETKYRQALKMLDDGAYEDAALMLKELDGYSDSANMIKETQYRQAKHFVETDAFDDALSLFVLLDGYSDSATMIKETYYKKAIDEYNNGKYLDAKNDFKASGNYGDTATYLLKIEDLEKKEATEEAHRKNVELLRSAYKSVRSNSRISLASDGLSITADSKDEYDFSTLFDILTIITTLNLPDSLYDAMVSTNSLMGRQSETYKAWNVSWSYHPDNGLDVIFKLVE